MAADTTLGFSPSYVFPPGETLAEVLEARQLSQADLAERTGLTPKTVNEVIKGKAPITPDTALHLERVLGAPASFWSNLQRRFDEMRAREAEGNRLRESVAWARRFPLRRMASWGWIELPAGRVDQVRCLLNFFGTSTPEAWGSWWRAVQVALRATKSYKVDQWALACWLRRGEIEAATIETLPYDSGRFREALDATRGTTRLGGVEFVGELRVACARAGVAVVFVPELPRIRTYGATRWLSPDKALIQLSLRQKSDDQLWFTFFHEAAHILLHPKRRVFLEQDRDGDALEEEADRFATDHLIPQSVYQVFVERAEFDAPAIEAFAAEVGIAPGIVVGRLQHDEYLPYGTWLNDLKKRYRFTDE